MRIVQTMLAKGFGGAERSFVDICKELAARGHQVSAICHRRGKALLELSSSDNLFIYPIACAGNWD